MFLFLKTYFAYLFRVRSKISTNQALLTENESLKNISSIDFDIMYDFNIKLFYSCINFNVSIECLKKM